MPYGDGRYISLRWKGPRSKINWLPRAEMPVECCAKDLPESDSACAACEASSRVVERSVQVASSALCEHISRFAALVALPQWKRRYLRASVSSRKVSCTGDSKKKELWRQPRTHAEAVSSKVLSHPFACRFSRFIGHACLPERPTEYANFDILINIRYHRI